MGKTVSLLLMLLLLLLVLVFVFEKVERRREEMVDFERVDWIMEGICCA